MQISKNATKALFIYSYYIALTEKVRTVVAQLIGDEKARLATRFIKMNWDQNYEVASSAKKQAITLEKFYAKLGFTSTSTEQFGKIVNTVLSYFGFTADAQLVTDLGAVEGIKYNQYVPVEAVFRLMGIMDLVFEGRLPSTTRSRRQGKKSSRRGKKQIVTQTAKMVNTQKVAQSIYGWISGTNFQANKAPANTLTMEIYAYSPSIRQVKDLFGKTAVRMNAVMVNGQFTITSTENVIVRKSHMATLLATHCISRETAVVPATDLLTKLITDGTIETSAFGIEVNTFVKQGFAKGFETTYENWLNQIGLINSSNEKIAPNASKIKAAATAHDHDQLSDLGTVITDDIDIETDVPMLVGASMASASPFAASLPKWQAPQTTSPFGA